MNPDLPTLVRTRLGLQAFAEHVLCAARHAATGRIGLLATADGFATPAFPSDRGDRTVTVSGLELVVSDDDGNRRSPLTTVGAAAAFVGIAPGAPTEVFTPTTALEPDVPLDLSPAAATQLAAWNQLGLAALTALRDDLAAAGLEPTEIQLWPEHFDQGFQAAEVNWGSSPGDASSDLPYLYVGPWQPPAPDGGFWNQPFGAARSADDVATTEAARAFFQEGRRALDL